MKNCNCFFQLQWVILLVLICVNCSETDLEGELSHSNLQIDTLTIHDLVIENYQIAPNLGSNERLYLGSKNDIEVPITFIQIPLSNILQPNYWEYVHDTTVQIDSLRLVLFSNDSLLNNGNIPSLYFSPDSQFDENKSTYLDYDSYSLADWLIIGEPEIKIEVDSLTSFTNTKIIWDLDTLLEALSDTLDSNLVRTFAIKFNEEEATGFIELYSEEASQGNYDPQIKMYFKRSSINSENTVVVDTSDVTIYSTGDLSIFQPNISNNTETNNLRVSNGIGLRALIQIPFISNSMPLGSIIRSANLLFPIIMDSTTQNYSVFIDPIVLDTSSIDTVSVYSIDPYIAAGYPYRVVAYQDSNRVVFSIKNILQNIILGNEDNIGFKIVADEKNDPFKSIWFDNSQIDNKPKLEILYVYNE